MKSLFIAVAFIVFQFSVCCAQPLNTKKLDSLFNMLQQQGLATGSVAISIDRKLAYSRAIGFALLDSNRKVLPDIHTKYRIGSTTKMFTAVMIFQLVEEGKISLNEKLADFFPQLPNAGKITIREMLYHRSGLHDYTHDTGFDDWMDKPKTHEEMLKIIAGKGSDFEPGTKAEYCNTNYLLLSYIIEKICKAPYATVVKERITQKLGLTDTYYGMPISITRNESASYKYTDSAWHKVKETDMSIHCGAGSLVSTPTDLTVFIQNLFAGRLISKAYVDSMHNWIDGYGMGMFPFDFDSIPGFGHNGRVEEFYSTTRYYPAKNLAISYVTNGILYPRSDIEEAVLKICFNKNYTIPFSKPIVLQNGDLDKYAGTYSSGGLPFKVTCKREDDKLVMEVPGKTMTVEPINDNYFMNRKTGSFFEFNPAIGELWIKETDNVYHLQRVK